MQLFRKHLSRMTFWERFANIAITCGIPIVLLDLVGAPALSLPLILTFIIPATLAGILMETAIEHLFFSPPKKGIQT